MDNQKLTRQKGSAGFALLVIAACFSGIFALVSLCAPYWGYFLIWGDGWSGTPTELFISNQLPGIGFISGALLFVICMLCLPLTRVKQRSSKPE